MSSPSVKVMSTQTSSGVDCLGAAHHNGRLQHTTTAASRTNCYA